MPPEGVMRILLLACLTALATSACVTTTDASYAVPALHKQASFDLGCPSNQLEIMETSQDQYGVRGCDKKTSYALLSCNAASQECAFKRNAPITTDHN
jgi:hypothetical protein